MQVAQALTVSFHNAQLFLLNQDDQPFVPMKPVVEGMGLAWQGQHAKLSSGRFKSTIKEIVMVAEDGKQRQMTCLPLRKLTGWLMSIHPNKVKPELREGIIAYQNECDDALWAYWNDQRDHQVTEAAPVAATQSVPELPPLLAQRWLTTYNSQGEQHTRLLPIDACIMNTREFIEQISDQNGIQLNTAELLQLTMQLMAMLQKRNLNFYGYAV